MVYPRGVSRPSSPRDALVADLLAAMPRFQEATDAVDEAAARALGINRTDLRCLGLLDHGPSSPSALAEQLQLSRGAMTTVLDRLEAAGWARRGPDPDDRRALRIELTDAARTRIGALWGPIAMEGAGLLDEHGDAELRAMLRFLRDATALQLRHAKRIADEPLP